MTAITKIDGAWQPGYAFNAITPALGDDRPDNKSTLSNLTIGGALAGSIDYRSDNDWFGIDLVAGQTYRFVAGAAGDPGRALRLGVFASGEEDHAKTGENEILFNATESGRYFLSVGDTGGDDWSSSQFQVTAQVVSSGPVIQPFADDYAASIFTTGRVSVNGSSNGNLETSFDEDWFAVYLTAGVTYSLDAEGTATGGGTLVDPYLYLYSGTGSIRALDDDDGTGLNAQIIYTPTVSGTYYMGVEASDFRATGTYRVSVMQMGGADDYGDTYLNAGSIAVGGTINGRIGTATDDDWFRIDLTSGRTYQIDLEGSATSAGTLSDPALWLWRISPLAIMAYDFDSGDGLNARITYTPTVTGTFYISAESELSTTGTYRLRVTDVTPPPDDYASTTSTTGRVSVGGTTMGALENLGDRDWFRVDLVAGRTYRITSDGAATGSGTLPDPYVSLRNGTGVLVATDDDSGPSVNASITFTAATSGTFYVETGASTLATGTRLGTYTVAVSDISSNVTAPPSGDDYSATTSTTGLVSPGGAIGGRIGAAGDADWFRVSLTAGRVYVFDMLGTQGSAGTLADPYLILRDSTGVELRNDDDAGDGLNARLSFTPTVTGTYYIDGRSSPFAASGTGTYRIEVADTGYADDIGNGVGTTALLDIERNGTIEYAGDSDWMRMYLTSGRTYEVLVEGVATLGGTLADPTIRIRSSTGTLLATDLDSGEGANARVHFSVPSTGYYYADVTAAGSGTGTYRVSLRQLSPNDDYGHDRTTHGYLAPGGSVTAQIQGDNDGDWFAMDLVAGATYRLNLTDLSAVAFDPALSIYTAAGARIENTSANNILFSPTVTGRYFVGASDQSYSNLDGARYRIDLVRYDDDYGHGIGTTGRVGAGTPVTGVINFNDDRDSFAITMQAGQTYLFNLARTEGPTTSPSLALLGATGTQLVASAGTALAYVPSTSGTYYITVQDTSTLNLTGHGYRLNVSSVTDDYAATTATTGTLTQTAAATGRINYDGDEDWFKVTLTTTSGWRFTVRENGTNQGDVPWLYIYNAAGTRVASSLTGQIDFIASTAGTYYVGVADWALFDLSGLGYRVTMESRLLPPRDDATLWRQSNQWYVSDIGSGTGGLRTDINVTGLWPAYRGTGILVGIVDSGIDITHPNLVANYDVLIDLDPNENDNNASPTYRDENHGTAVSGAVAAVSTISGQGSGVAPGATITGYRLDFDNLSLAALKANLDAQQAVHVSNNSWGFINFLADNFLNPEYAPLKESLLNGVSYGRGGLGTAFVFAAGNSRASGDNVNNHNFQNSRFVTTVASIAKTGAISSFSTPGAAILVSAPGEEILTTDRTGSGLGYNPTLNYAAVDGTSFASPIVSGVVALMLQANPGIGWRDIKTILAVSARHDPLTQSGWASNGAVTWNGGGMRASHDYGFGLVDATAAVRIAETWSVQSTIANEVMVERTAAPNVGIPDADENGVTTTIDVDTAVNIEHVEVHVVIDHSYVGDLIVRLTSPSGMQSVLLSRPGRSNSNNVGTSQDDVNFVFSSNHFRGENGVGTWTLQVVDAEDEDIGTLMSWSLRLYGAAASNDNTYIFTNEYATIADREPGRKVLVDREGIDMLNLAAVSTAVVIDLTPGGSSTIAGQSLTLDPGTLIENVVSGDGNDVLSANSLNNWLRGARGNDTLNGLGGDDILDGGAGADHMIGGGGSDTFIVDNVGDVLVEAPDEGYDAVLVYLDTYTLHANVERADLVAGSTLNGNAENNVLVGNASNNTLRGLGGDDTLRGGAGNDTLEGGEGNDILQGGDGNDTIWTGVGGDHIVMEQYGASYDSIHDFAAVEGGDVLDFAALLQGAGYVGVDPMADGYIHLAQSGPDTHVLFDSNGGGDSYSVIAVVAGTQATAITSANLNFIESGLL